MLILDLDYFVIKDWNDGGDVIACFAACAESSLGLLPAPIQNLTSVGQELKIQASPLSSDRCTCLILINLIDIPTTMGKDRVCIVGSGNW
jgi:hypothetical protein